MKSVIEMLTRRVDYARFSRVYFSEPFQQGLVSAIDLRERTVRDRSELPDGKERIRVYIAPRVNMPALIEKFTEGYTVGYEETTLFDRVGRYARIAVQTPAGELLQIGAETHFREESDGVRTRIDLHVRVKIIGAGAVIERFVFNETKRRYEIVEKELQRFIDERRDLTAA